MVDRTVVGQLPQQPLRVYRTNSLIDPRAVGKKRRLECYMVALGIAEPDHAVDDR